MTEAGYSGKPLIAKLGYKPGDYVLVIDPPEWFPEELALNQVTPTDSPDCDWAQGFFTTAESLRKFVEGTDFSKIKKGFWVSWPKKSSGVASELTEQDFRDALLPTGWVDTKVAAIDETWSGLKFLRRKA